jgi:hypothetical protein
VLAYYILDDDGEPVPVDVLTWAAWFEDRRARIVLQTAITRRGRAIERPLRRGHGYTQISTVFLGLDHNFYDAGPPILWESMTFGGPLDGETHRYASKLDALRGHTTSVARAQAAARVPRRLRKALGKRYPARLGHRERRAVARFERRAAA